MDADGEKKRELFFLFPEAQVHSTKGQQPTLSTVTMQGRTQSGEDLSECAGLPHPGDWRAQVVVVVVVVVTSSSSSSSSSMARLATPGKRWEEGIIGGWWLSS